MVLAANDFSLDSSMPSVAARVHTQLSSQHALFLMLLRHVVGLFSPSWQPQKID